jgi:hypothetical protein
MPERNLVCYECGDKFETEPELQEHKQLFHSPEVNDEEYDNEKQAKPSRTDKEQRPGARKAAGGRSRKTAG